MSDGMYYMAADFYKDQRLIIGWVTWKLRLIMARMIFHRASLLVTGLYELCSAYCFRVYGFD